MEINEKVLLSAAKVGIGTASGIVTGMSKSMPAPHVMHQGLITAAGNFAHTTTKAMRAHKGLLPALGLGATALAGPALGAATAVGVVAVAAAPFVLGTAAVTAAGYGLFKLFNKD